MSKKQILDTSPIPDFDWESCVSDCPSRKKYTIINSDNPEDLSGEILEKYNKYFNSNDILTPDIKVNGVYEGIVDTLTKDWCTIDIGYRESIYIDMEKESKEFKDMLIPGNVVDVQIIESMGSTQGDYILGSIEAGHKKAVFDDIIKSIESSKTAYNATVISIIPGGGYIVDIQGIECFMPGSLSGINKLYDFESILDTDIYVVPMNYSNDRGTIVVSHREYLKAMIPTMIDKIKEYENNTVINGVVTGSAKYGVFCEFNECLTGMIHVNDLDADTAVRHRGQQIKPGESIEFFIKKIISDNKITLSQKNVEPLKDPWFDAKNRFKTPIEVTGKIKSVKDYGVFIDIGGGLVGLLHVSEFPEGYDISSISNGDDITITVTRINEETRKVFMEL